MEKLAHTFKKKYPQYRYDDIYTEIIDIYCQCLKKYDNKSTLKFNNYVYGQISYQLPKRLHKNTGSITGRIDPITGACISKSNISRLENYENPNFEEKNKNKPIEIEWHDPELKVGGTIMRSFENKKQVLDYFNIPYTNHVIGVQKAFKELIELTNNKNEKYYQTQIVQYLKSKGAYVLKTTPGAGIPTGTPDIVAFLPNGKTLFIEVKATKGRISEAQKIQIERLRKLGYKVIATASGEQDYNEVKREI
jgi:hypothetical protein